MKIVCAHCGRESDKPSGGVNRARRRGLKIYCGRTCSGFGRRLGKSLAERRKEKRAYDAEYRRLNREAIKAKKRAHHTATYDPVAAAAIRKERMPLHVAYCRRPEYRAWKAEYDRKLRAKEYGEFAEAYLLLQSVDREIATRMTRQEIYAANGTLNKRLQRRRDHDGTFGVHPQAGAVGNPHRHQERQNAGEPG